MAQNWSEDSDSESNTGAQLSTFRNTENVSIHGGTFSVPSTVAEKGTCMDSGCQSQVHDDNTSGPHRSSRHRDRRRPYPKNTYRRHKYDPEPSLTSGARAPSRSDRHRRPSAAASSTNSNQQATFGKADVANVSGGIFLNVYQCPPPEGTSRPHIQDCNIVQTGVGIAGTDRNLSTGSGGLVRPSNAETDIPPTVRTGYDIYYYQLLAERRGSPIWIPGPDMNLPTEYRKEGTRIGDVGILYCSEGFGFLFNIFLPADHPINQGRVPPGFEPLNLSKLEHELKKQVVFGPKSYLTSTSVTTSSNMDSSDFIFETSAAEGAVLIMPDGAITEDLMCRKSIKNYLAKNARTWYKFISEVREREVRNGDIRLVMGFDKVSSWGIATSACSVGERARLEFKNVGDISQTYTWRCVGRGSGRVGPCDQEMQGILSLQEMNRSPLQNQAVFLRTLNFDLSGKCWNDLVNHRIRSGDLHIPDSPPGGQYTGSRPGHQAGSNAGGGGSHSTSGDVTFYSMQSGLSVVHPSSSMNRILLDKYPNAQIAITEDTDWMSVITEDDVEMPKADELCIRLLAMREVCEEDGIITFRSEEDFTDSEDISSLNFGSKNHVYDSDVAVVDPFDPLHPTEETGKGPETGNFQDPSRHRRASASEDVLPAIPPAALQQLPAHTSTHTPIHIYPETSTHADTPSLPPSPHNLVPIHDTGLHRVPASPSCASNTFSPLDHESSIWQFSNFDENPLSPLPNSGFLQPPRPLYHHHTSPSLPLNAGSTFGIHCRITPDCEINTSGDPSPSATNSSAQSSDVFSGLVSSPEPLFQQQHQQFLESELCVDGITSNYSLDNSAQRVVLQQHQDIDRPQQQRVPSVTSTAADGVVPGTPLGSTFLSTPPPSDHVREMLKLSFSQLESVTKKRRGGISARTRTH